MNNEVEINNNLLLEFFIEKGPLAAVLISVAFNLLLILKEIYGEAKNLEYYATSVIIGVVLFASALAILHIYENKLSKKCNFRILKEDDEYNIIEENDGELSVICIQYLKIKPTKENNNVFRLFYPIQGFYPIKFEFPDGTPKLLGYDKLRNHTDGVEVYFENRSFVKGKTEEITVIWTYEKIPGKKGLKVAFIRRPTFHLDISVILPERKPKPNKYGWSLYNTEKSQIKIGDAICRKYGERFRLSKSFRRTNEGFSYAIWWES